MVARYAAVAAILLCAASATVVAGTPLSLDQAIETALKQNQQVKIARYGVDKADAQAQEAVGNALPTVGISAGLNRNIQLPVFFFPVNGTMTPVRFGLDNQYNLSATASQILFNSAVFNGIGTSQIYQDAARASYKSAVATVVTETKRRYYNALAAKQFVSIAKQTLENTEENYKTISALFKEGLVAEFDQIRAQVAVENVRPEVTNAEAGFNNAVSALMTYLSMDLKDTVEITTDVLGTPQALPDEDSAIIRAIQENYDLKALELQMKVADGVIDVYRSTYYPTLTLIGQWQNQGMSDTYSNWLSASSAFVGLNFSFNIFNGTRTLAQVDQAKADYESVREQYALLKNNVKLQVRVIVNDLRSALLRIEAQQSTVQQAQRGFEISRIRYTEGTGSLLEINDAQVALSRAQVNRLTALLDYYTKRAEFDRVVGNIEEKYLRMAE